MLGIGSEARHGRVTLDEDDRVWHTFSSGRSDILEIIQSGLPLPPGVVLGVGSLNRRPQVGTLPKARVRE